MVRLEEFTNINAPIDRCFDLARSVEVHLAGNIHCGEQALATGGLTTGLVGLGQRVTWRAKHFGVWHKLTSEITKFSRPSFFQDVMIQGAFRMMCHDHYFRRINGCETEMRDVFCFSAPFPLVGLLTESLVLRRYMRALLQERNLVIKQVAESARW